MLWLARIVTTAACAAVVLCICMLLGMSGQACWFAAGIIIGIGATLAAITPEARRY